MANKFRLDLCASANPPDARGAYTKVSTSCSFFSKRWLGLTLPKGEPRPV